MTRDLGIDDAQVHDGAEAVLTFWLEEVPPAKRFARDDALDRICAERFGALRADVIATHAAGWRAAPRSLLAAIILTDQFSRNIFRNSAEAFAADPLARALTDEALAKGWHHAMTAEQRQFLLIPLMHSEIMTDQVRGLTLFAADGGAQYDYAGLHAAQIARFGRFPQRNAALGRASTPAERAFLADPANHF
jgi:uncharacterized protein (DUF924 family)